MSHSISACLNFMHPFPIIEWSLAYCFMFVHPSICPSICLSLHPSTCVFDLILMVNIKFWMNFTLPVNSDFYLYMLLWYLWYALLVVIGNNRFDHVTLGVGGRDCHMVFIVQGGNILAYTYRIWHRLPCNKMFVKWVQESVTKLFQRLML